jgi:hypothetical protein
MADEEDPGARELARLAIASHGGEHAWDTLERRTVRVWYGGLAFAAKLQGHALRAVEAEVATSGQHVRLRDYPSIGYEGVLEQDGSVRIQPADAPGEPSSSRENAGAAFADLRHRLWWDRLDTLYFAGSALWTYLSSPFVWLRDGYGLRQLEPWREGGERWRRLAVRFPDAVQTHCREQVFHIDEQGLIRRHDYTPEPFRNGIAAADYSYDIQRIEGLLLATRRAVFPRRRDGRARDRPRLVWIEMSAAD